MFIRLVSSVLLAFAAVCCCVFATATATIPVTITNSRGGSIEATANVIVSGFTWVENLIFDNDGRLIITDAVRGEIYVVTLNGGSYTANAVVTGLGRVLGTMQTQPPHAPAFVASHVLVWWRRTRRRRFGG